MLNVVMLNDVMLSDVMLNDVMLGVVGPFFSLTDVKDSHKHLLLLGLTRDKNHQLVFQFFLRHQLYFKKCFF